MVKANKTMATISKNSFASLYDDEASSDDEAIEETMVASVSSVKKKKKEKKIAATVVEVDEELVARRRERRKKKRQLAKQNRSSNINNSSDVDDSENLPVLEKINTNMDDAPVSPTSTASQNSLEADNRKTDADEQSHRVQHTPVQDHSAMYNIAKDTMICFIAILFVFLFIDQVVGVNISKEFLLLIQKLTGV